MPRLTIVSAVLLATSVTVGHTAPRAAAAAGALTIEQLIDIKHPSNPAWSTDGKHISFTWDRAGVSQRYVSDLDGRQPHVAPSAEERADGVPSPDGNRIAFVKSSSATSAEAPASTGRGGRGGRGTGATGPSELWIRNATGGQETRLAASESSIAGVAWSPDGAYILYSAGGGQIRHEQTPAYSGTKIIYTITENVPGQLMVIATPPAPAARASSESSSGAARASGGGAPLALNNAGPGFGARRWLDAHRFLVDRTSPDFKRRTTSVVDIVSGESKVLHEDVEDKFWSMTGDAGGGSQPSPDKKWIMFLSDRDGWDHIYVMPAPSSDGARRVQPSGGDAIQLTKGRFEAWRPQWSPDGTRIAFDANEPDHYGDRHLYLATLNGDPAKATITALTTGRGTDIAPVWSPDGARLVYQHTDAHNSADLWVIDAKPNAKPLRVSDSMPASMDKSAFVEPEAIHYAGPDGQQVPAWLFVPKNLDRTKKHPAIVWIHGDGVNQNYDGWHVQRNYAVYYSMHQYLLQQGYVVIAPDYRGSIGYGRAWREGVYMDVGGKDAKDAWMAANYLKTLGYVDTDRVGVWGLSYGGFFTLIAVTDQPKLFRAAVDVAGVVDYAMYYEDPYHGGWTASRIGTPAEHPDVYANASPISHVDRLEHPLLILHGTSDVNVPYLHSVRLIDELLKKGKGPLVQFMTYPGEFHYFTREHVLRDAWHRVDDFFRENLQPQSRGTTSEARAR
jgi:dipeptidyl aminopeptidase/acylaminoacyl peptidase